MIKYHDNKNGVQYGNDGKLTNNWNADGNYTENEYINVHFRIEYNGFSGMYGCFTDDQARALFDGEKEKIFLALGWTIKKPEFSGACMDVENGKASLYLHPQDFSGNVRKKDVKRIAEALASSTVFNLRWVDLYETVYDITDQAYMDYLKTKTAEARKLVFEACRTTRTNKYKYMDQVAENVAKRVKLPRIGCKSVYKPDGIAIDFIASIIADMENEGYISRFTDGRENYVRTLNKTELKKAKLKAIA